MIFQKKQLALFTIGASVLALGACTNHPNAMPSGYTHHKETYKSANPPPSSKVTVHQRQYMDAAQAEQFRSAVYDLLERLTMRAGMPPKPVYIMAPTPMTTFYANIDNDLRESMRHIGYAISDTPDDAYIFTYEAMSIPMVEGDDNMMADNVYLTLRIFDSFGKEARQLTEESGRYFIQGASGLDIMAAQYNITPVSQNTASQSMPEKEMMAPEPEMQMPSLMAEAPMESSMKTEMAPMTDSMVEEMEPIMAETPMMDEPLAPMMEKTMDMPPRESVSRAPQETVAIKPTKPARQEMTVSEPVDEKLDMKKSKLPSRDDIIIINREDKAAMNDSVETTIEESMSMMPESADAMPETMDTRMEGAEDALQQAIPSEPAAVRQRVSQPADY